ncbi:tetratricopeptide repeat protein [Roseimarinus sediminis]|uniref:tetratricopeptide repeat protein n=1 Tax=Roseimarinus sediminis TaxID=1610899 RepID=UPI003D223A3E
MVKNKHHQEDGLKDVEEALTKTEQFLENHLNLVLYVIGGLIVVILGVIGYQKYYVAPRNLEAQEQMYAAQNYFSTDSFAVAINGDGVTLGFLDIIDNYGGTDAANLSRYYTGIAYLHLGEYETAIDYLNQFDTDDMLLAPMTESAKGDAYVEMEQYSKAISAYQSALKKNENDFTSPAIMNKLALAYEASGDTQKALATYEKIMKEYPSGTETVNVEKSIARLKQ